MIIGLEGLDTIPSTVLRTIADRSSKARARVSCMLHRLSNHGKRANSVKVPRQHAW